MIALSYCILPRDISKSIIGSSDDEHDGIDDGIDDVMV